MADDHDWGREGGGWGPGGWSPGEWWSRTPWGGAGSGEGASFPKMPGFEAGGPFEDAMLRSRLASLEGTRAWLEWMRAAGLLEMAVSSMGQFMGPGGGGADADAFIARIDEQIAQVRHQLSCNDAEARPGDDPPSSQG